MEEATKSLKMRISPLMALMMTDGCKDDTLRRQFIPSLEELRSADNKLLFPEVNDDDGYSTVKGLVHRYPTKVLVFPSNFCGCYCNRDVEDTLSKQECEKIFDYLHAHPQINEVIFSGGDSLVVDDDIYDYILGELAKISTVKIVRFHTRMVITVP